MVLPYNLNRLGGQHKRPYYCEVEYLQSDGNCYIDTGWVQGSSYTEEISFDIPSASQTIAGARATSTRNGLFYWNNTQGTLSYTIAQSNSSQTPFQLGSLSGNKLIRVEVADNTGSIWVDKVKVYDNTSFSGTYAQSNTLVLFGSNNNGSIEERGVVKIRSFYGTSASGTVDLIPVLDWSMTPCFYDRANNRLLYNGGTGTFTVGRQIHYIDYLESIDDGEEYIDTLFVGDQDTELSVTMMSLSDARNYTQAAGRLQTGGSINRLTINCNNSTYTAGTATFGNNTTTKFRAVPYVKNTFMWNKNGAYQNGVALDTFTSVSDFSTGANLYMMKANGSTAYGPWRFFGGYVKESGVMVRDYYPALDEDCVAFAFDKVYHKIYDNAGTGTFKHSDFEVDCIDNTHLASLGTTAYIQTNVAYSTSNAYRIDQDIEVAHLGEIRFSGWNAGGAIGVNRSTGNYRDGNSDLQPLVEDGTRVNAIIRINASSTTQTYYTLAYGTSISTGSRGHGSLGNYATLGYPLMVSTNNSNGYTYYAYGRLWGCKIYSGSSLTSLTLVRDFKPIVRNGKAGLLDTVNDVFYSSIGSAQFRFRAK